MKKAAFLLVFCALAVLANAQTKRIAHRTHSGKNTTLRLESEGNFGEMDPIYYQKLRLRADSLMKADSLAKAAQERDSSGQQKDSVSPQQPKPRSGSGRVQHGLGFAQKPEE